MYKQKKTGIPGFVSVARKTYDSEVCMYVSPKPMPLALSLYFLSLFQSVSFDT